MEIASEPFAEANEPDGKREEQKREAEVREIHGSRKARPRTLKKF
jgi:hypothetical protein